MSVAFILIATSASHTPPFITFALLVLPSFFFHPSPGNGRLDIKWRVMVVGLGLIASAALDLLIEVDPAFDGPLSS